MVSTYGNFVTTELRGFQEYTDVLNTPDIITTAGIIAGLPDAFTRCAHFVGGSSREGLTWEGIPFNASVPSENRYIFSCYIRLSDLTPASEYLLLKVTAGGGASVLQFGQLNFYLEIDGDLELADIDNVPFTTISTPFTVDTWHFLEIRILPSTDGSTADGEVQMWIDGIEVLANTTGVTMASHSNTKGIALGGSSTIGEEVYFAGGNLIYDSTSVLDRITGSNVDQRWEAVGPYTNNVGASATPDDDGPGTGGGGDNLTTGDWDDIDDIPFIDATPATYESNNTDGSVYADGGSFAGPNGDSNIDGDSNIGAAKYIFRAERGNGQNTTMTFYFGNDVDSPGSVGESSDSLTGSPVNFTMVSESADVVPLSTQNIRQGFGRGSGGRDLIHHDNAAFIFHLPDLPAPPAGGLSVGSLALMGVGL